LGIKQVIAVPFFLETLADGQPQREIVGNLFAATKSRRFRAGEIDLLRAFGLQAAAGIRNARLYSKSEERREAAQIFGKMAFSAAAYVHDLRNHISAVRLHLQLLQHLEHLPEKDREKRLNSSAEMIACLDQVTKILDNLHEPWRQVLDVATDVNRCLIQAIEKGIPDPDVLRETEGIEVKSRLADKLPPIKTSPDMLSEAFRVLIKNAIEALCQKHQGGELRIESRLSQSDDSVVEVLVSDSGTGIKQEHLSKVFEMKWSTKEGAGMGFGLFWTKDYIDGLGGKIKVESIWQKGTTFHVSLPACCER
jgi:signal transduction histidine kinase